MQLLGLSSRYLYCIQSCCIAGKLLFCCPWLDIPSRKWFSVRKKSFGGLRGTWSCRVVNAAGEGRDVEDECGLELLVPGELDWSVRHRCYAQVLRETLGGKKICCPTMLFANLDLKLLLSLFLRAFQSVM